MKSMTCPKCYIYENLYIKNGKTCKTCNMILEDGGKEFCSERCKARYIKIKRRTN